MKVRAIKCDSCGDTIYSRTRHDMRYCSCKSIAIDGGGDYVKITFNTPSLPDIFEIEVNVTKEQLYNDWNNGENKFGLIPR